MHPGGQAALQRGAILARDGDVGAGVVFERRCGLAALREERVGRDVRIAWPVAPAGSCVAAGSAAGSPTRSVRTGARVAPRGGVAAEAGSGAARARVGANAGAASGREEQDSLEHPA
jgi:hypothetical protein